VDPRHFGGGASRSNVSSSWSQWGRETVRAGKERPLTPTETGLLMLPSIDESPTARRMDRRNELYQSPTQRATFISPQHVRNKDDMSPSPSSRRFINVMQKTLAYDQKYDPHTLNRGMPREIMQAVSVIETKIRDYSEGMLRAFRNIDLSKTGMITQRELGELLARFGALTDARHFDVVWDMMDNERKGSIHFFTFITKFKHGLSHELLSRDMPDPAATPAPSMHRSQYVPSTEHGAHAMRGKGGTKTVGSVMGEVRPEILPMFSPTYM
jgi:Ca2+-binding EF-hand superfamily protein